MQFGTTGVTHREALQRHARTRQAVAGVQSQRLGGIGLAPLNQGGQAAIEQPLAVLAHGDLPIERAFARLAGRDIPLDHHFATDLRIQRDDATNAIRKLFERDLASAKS